MNTQQTHPPSAISRRSAAALIFAGITLPANRAMAGKEVFVRSKPHVQFSRVVLTTCSGESMAVRFSSDLLIGSNGFARGTLRFDSESEGRMDYAPEAGGMDFDPSGQPIRARVLLRLRRTAGRLAQDFAMLFITPDASQDCLIYTTQGPWIDQVSFEVPGSWTVRW